MKKSLLIPIIFIGAIIIISGCENIEDPCLKGSKKDRVECYTDQAILSKNPQICDAITELVSTSYIYEQSVCYNELAIIQLDPTNCDKISTLKTIPNTWEPTTWPILSDSCYIDIVERTRDRSICDKVSDDKKQECLNA